MPHCRVPPLPLPVSFSATIVRSDGNRARIWIEGGIRRVESMPAGGPPSVTISRPDRGLLYSIDPASRTWFEIPLTGELRAALDADVEDDVQWQLLGTLEIDGQRYDEYEVWPTHGKPRFPRERICVDPETGMRRRVTTLNLRGEEVLTAEYQDAIVGPQPIDVFEVPADFTRVR